MKAKPQSEEYQRFETLLSQVRKSLKPRLDRTFPRNGLGSRSQSHVQVINNVTSVI